MRQVQTSVVNFAKFLRIFTSNQAALVWLCCILISASSCKSSPPAELSASDTLGSDSSMKQLAQDSAATIPKLYLPADSAFQLARSPEAKAKMFYDLADLYLREQDTIAAITKLEQALKLNPKYVPYLLRLSAIYAEQGNARALPLSTRIIKYSKERQHLAQAYFMRGIYYKERLRILATQRVRQPIAGVPAKSQLSESTSSKLIALKNSALANWDSAIIADWTMIIAYLEKGALLLAQADLPQAKKCFQLAYRINHHHPEVYYWLGRVAEAEHENVAALAHYRNSLLMDKQFQPSKTRLEQLQKSQ